MLNFLTRSFVFVSIFSLIRLYIGILVASYIFPADYAVVIVPLIIFGFLDIFIEGGYISSIIKHGVSRAEEKEIINVQVYNFLKFSPLVILLIEGYDIYHVDKTIPILVLLNYWLTSLMKIGGYSKEGLLIYEGRYIFLESLKFFISLLTYGIVFLLIFNTNLEGYYLLCLWISVYALVYVAVVNCLNYNSFHSQDGDIFVLKQFAQTNRNVSMLFNISNRLDELTASNILGASSIGLFAKFKEIAISFGEITNKVISRPWFYVACSNPRDQIFKSYFILVLLFFAIFTASFPLLSNIILIIIKMLGQNWIDLVRYADYIIYFLYFYFICEFSKNTLLACEEESFVFKLERIFFVFRILIYTILVISSYMGLFRIDLSTFVIIEILLRITIFLIENLKIFRNFYINLNNK